MIVNSIVGFFFRLLAFIINMFPSLSIPVSVLDAFSQASSFVSVINYYIPFSTFIVCLSVFFVVWLACGFISAILQLL